MPPKDYHAVRAWTQDEIEDNRLECFMRLNRKEMLTVLLTSNATNPSELTAKLVKEWNDQKGGDV